MQSMLYEFQKNVIETSKPNYIYPLDTGTGKTIIALHHYLKYYYASRCTILIASILIHLDFLSILKELNEKTAKMQKLQSLFTWIFYLFN